MTRRYHLIGIGGAGMSALARALHSRGEYVCGSDMFASPVLDRLEIELGVPLHVGHTLGNIGDVDIVVASAAIKDDNPEMLEAHQRGLPIVSRAEMLGRVMKRYEVRIAVSGTHGKTTTSAMAAQMLVNAGVDPTALIGSEVPAWDSNTRIGRSGVIVAEACEAYGSFLDLHPTHAIVTNIEADHLDYYKTLDALVRSFRRFAEQTSRHLIVCSDGPAAEMLAGAGSAEIVTYGLEPGADLTADIVGDGEFDVRRGNRLMGRIRCRLPGRHNVANALAVAALGLVMDIPFDTLAEGIAEFSGTSRRFEVLADSATGLTIVDDYAHHPTEIRATLSAARSRFAGSRIVALFQPHLPSRTRDLMDEFADAFGDADLVVITDIYLARESAIPEITAEKLATEVRLRRGDGRVWYGGDLTEAESMLRDLLTAGDVLLTLGAGDVRRVAERIGSAGSAVSTRDALPDSALSGR